MVKRQKAQPAEKVESWPIAKIKPYANNPRTHGDDQIVLLANLMVRYGIDQPIVVDEKGVILKGHGRRLAAFRAGFTDYPVVVLRGLSETDKKAVRIADNQVTLLAGWDAELIKLEVTELKMADYELPLLGFSERELMRFSNEIGDGQDTAEQLTGLSYAVVVRCKDETEQRALLGRFEKEGLHVEALIS